MRSLLRAPRALATAALSTLTPILFAASAAASTMPALPASTGLPSVTSPTLGAPGSLDPQIASWSSYFAQQAGSDTSQAESSLGIDDQASQFAQLWAQTEEQASQAGQALPTASLPSLSSLQNELPGVSTSDIAPLPEMAPPTLVMPNVPSPTTDTTAGWDAAFGAAPVLTSSMPSSVSAAEADFAPFELNPTYATSGAATAAYEQALGCVPGRAVSCPGVLASPSQMARTVQGVAKGNTNAKKVVSGAAKGTGAARGQLSPQVVCQQITGFACSLPTS